MSKRISKKIPEYITSAQFDEALARYANAHLREEEINNKLASEMELIKNKYSGELTFLTRKKTDALAVVETYCREQKQSLFSTRRSIHTAYGTLGFRLGTPKLATIPGISWQHAIEKLKEQLPQYIRNTEEPAKDLLINDRSREDIAMRLPGIGLQVIQDDLFFISLKTGSDN
ncbi:MAG: host-nuclease inhibitor Gam family protein [Taibaiella sp.]|nr:host-nuclease inhibitor Gam family protein [Taibaiella sp.]